MEKKIFKNFQCIFTLLHYLPLKDDLCQVWLKLAHWFWRRRFLYDPTPFLWLSPLWRGPGPLFEKFSVNPHYLRMICTKFDWNWPANFQCIFTLLHYLPLERGNPLYLNNLKSHPPKDDLCQVWLKLAEWFWRRRFLYDPTPFLWLSPLWRGPDPLFEQF
jgi:hypothetical protein